MSTSEYLAEYENADLHTGAQHRMQRQKHDSLEGRVTDRQRDQALSKETPRIATTKMTRARGSSASTALTTESKRRGADRAQDGLNGRGENDIIRLLWDAYQPDSNDELSSKRMDDVMNDFGLWGNSDAFIAELMGPGGRAKIDCAAFTHWWNDHAKRAAFKNHSAWFVLESLRQAFNRRMDADHARHASGSDEQSAAEACAVTADTLSEVLLSPFWKELLEQETKQGDASGESKKAVAGGGDAAVATPEWARETAVKVLDRIGLSSAPSAKFSLMELWWAFAGHKKSLQLLLPSMRNPSPDMTS